MVLPLEHQKLLNLLLLSSSTTHFHKDCRPIERLRDPDQNVGEIVSSVRGEGRKAGPEGGVDEELLQTT